MEYSYQFDPLQPDKPAELTCDGVIIATTSLKNAQELANKLNSQADLYEALKGLLKESDIGEYVDPAPIAKAQFLAQQALTKVKGD